MVKKFTKDKKFEIKAANLFFLKKTSDMIGSIIVTNMLKNEFYKKNNNSVSSIDPTMNLLKIG